ncbi:hypothetical protein PpBr36_08089 [Pyricularia pennisetigena]|uniref:hypothetical protein n=1 Tax=Pyricularia pennisetigena TaxID=1578925 RepID=UPI0011513E62|nr:hypothetical protein PpBr36_08089 [Pyricularia pennisetigena]TLS24564.1 hypothetical protein PpBr36_08089 [Pyricularia pennisetigena]
MGTIPHVLHQSARPIRPSEFADVVQALCRPRMHTARSNMPIPVTLAISGGVDSMAMAWLCSEVRRLDPSMRVADHRVLRFLPMIVDHDYRRHSYREARTVADYLREHLKMRPVIAKIMWNKLNRDRMPNHGEPSGMGKDASRDDSRLKFIRPQDIPNFETVAREQRYRLFAQHMLHERSMSLFLAHHEDDQYEWLLMRLMDGHGPRGLVGIPAANQLPHTQDIHGSYESGLIDDQNYRNPLYRFNPTTTESKAIRTALREQMMHELHSPPSSSPETGSAVRDYLDSLSGTENFPKRGAPELEPCRVEDGGTMLYRPMLEFSKDRIIATCLENGVPWFEDSTNKDVTLTPRNAIRHMVKHYKMPVALQKPAILAMSSRIRRRLELQNQEADRIFNRFVLYEFHPNVGSIMVEFPNLSRPGPRRKHSIYTARWRQVALENKAIAAAQAFRRLLRIVSPQSALPTAEDLQPFVGRVLPSLAEKTTSATDEAAPTPPKSFVISGVHCVPMQPKAKDPNQRLRWQLARAPHNSPAREPLPSVQFRSRVSAWDFPDKKQWWCSPDTIQDRLGAVSRRHRFLPYDGGRFWVSVRHRLPINVHVGPLALPYLRHFRDGLPDDASRRRLDDLLKRYAANKLRWTLPAVYVSGPISWVQDPDIRDHPHTRPSRARQEEIMRLIESSRDEMHIISLPTLDMCLPSFDHWLRCEFRFRKVDRAVPRNLERTRIDSMLAVVGFGHKQGTRVDKRRLRFLRPRRKHAVTRVRKPPIVRGVAAPGRAAAKGRLAHIGTA